MKEKKPTPWKTVTDGRVKNEKNSPPPGTLIKTKDVCAPLGSGLTSGHHGGRKSRKREREIERGGEVKRKREVSTPSALPHCDGWSLEPAILNPLEGHFCTFLYKSPDKLFTSCSPTQHDICV